MVLLLLFGMAAITPLSGAWELQTFLNVSNFFNDSYWNFITGNDPTHGYVNYVDKKTAISNGYITTQTPQGNHSVYIGCNDIKISMGRGRDSVRLESKQRYDYGLFMLYLHHMPTGCGTV